MRRIFQEADLATETTAAVSNLPVRIIRSILSWSVATLGLLVSLAAIMQLDTAPVFGDDYPPDWPRASALALLALVPALSVGLAVQRRRQAGILLLAASPVMGICNTWSEVQTSSFSGLIVAFGGGSFYFLIPGLFFLLTARAGWQPLMSSRRMPGIRISLRVFSASLLLAAWAALGLLAAVAHSRNWNDFKSCYKGSSAVLTTKKFPGSVVFIARVVLVGNAVGPTYDYSNWCVVRVEHRYWGGPWWSPGFAVLRGFFKKGERGEFLVDFRRSQGLLLHFLPVFEPYPCAHLMPLADAVVHLRVLRDGAPKSGVRIIGCVYSRANGSRQPAQGVNVLIKGPGGIVSATTDKQGIYDQNGLPPGRYTVQIESAGRTDEPYSREEGDATLGEAWGATLERR